MEDRKCLTEECESVREFAGLPRIWRDGGQTTATRRLCPMPPYYTESRGRRRSRRKSRPSTATRQTATSILSPRKLGFAVALLRPTAGTSTTATSAGTRGAVAKSRGTRTHGAAGARFKITCSSRATGCFFGTETACGHHSIERSPLFLFIKF